jgi:hypothetical protein
MKMGMSHLKKIGEGLSTILLKDWGIIKWLDVVSIIYD